MTSASSPLRGGKERERRSSEGGTGAPTVGRCVASVVATGGLEPLAESAAKGAEGSERVGLDGEVWLDSRGVRVSQKTKAPAKTRSPNAIAWGTE